MSSLLSSLQIAAQSGIIRAIDYQFARFVTQQAQNSSQSELICATAFVLSQSGEANHICINLKHLAGTSTPLFADGPAFNWPDQTSWSEFLLENKIASQPGDEQTQLMVLDGDRLYLARNWFYEQLIASDLYQRASSPIDELPNDLALATLELDRQFPQQAELKGETDWQRVAAAASLLKRLTVITGGPGTGKTTTVVRLLALQIALQGESSTPPVIRLAAPTGKAAARMAESIRDGKKDLRSGRAAQPTEEWIISRIPEEATTLHRLLGARPDSTSFRHNAENQLLADILIIDEVSMVDLALMAKLLQAVPKECRVIFLGDKDQLSSVEAGSVMAELCSSLTTDPEMKLNYSATHAKTLQQLTGYDLSHEVSEQPQLIADSLCSLRKVWRFNHGIKELATAVNRGDFKSALPILESEQYPDTELETNVSAESIAKAAESHYQKYLNILDKDPLQILEAFDDFRVLCAMRKGPVGVEALNQQIERRLMLKLKTPAGTEYYAGRPVMITTNDYNVKLFNGDIGVMLEDNGQLYACFATLEKNEKGETIKTVRKVLPSRLPQHETAYAMTIHKSQGSGFTDIAVVLPDAKRGEQILSRELIYTGITRARKKVTLYAEKAAFTLAVKKRTQRESGLSDAMNRLQ